MPALTHTRTRTIAATGFALCASLLVLYLFLDAPTVAYLPGGGMILGALAFQGKPIGVQLFARAVTWTGAMFATLLAHMMTIGNPPLPMWCMSLAAVLACLSLMSAGSTGLSDDSRFQPNALRGVLTLALILAIGDSATLLVVSLAAWDGGSSDAFWFACCTALMLVGVFGLFRLKTWGLIVNLISNLAIAWLTGTNALDVGPFKLVFITTALLQILVSLPVWISIVRKRPLRVPSWARNRGLWLSNLALVGVMAIAVQPMFFDSALLAIAQALGVQ